MDSSHVVLGHDTHWIYGKYPMFRPHVGANHRPDLNSPLLLVGESHYLPEYSTQHINSDRWYSSDFTTLDSEERRGINTSELVPYHASNGFRERGVSIWRLSFREINDCGPRFADYRRVVDEVVFCNFFLRPAVTSESLQVTKQDRKVANEVFRILLDTYKPRAVAFVSRKAYDNCDWVSSLSIPAVSTPHPSCAHWNRVSAAYGNKRGRDVLGDLARSLQWHIDGG